MAKDTIKANYRIKRSETVVSCAGLVQGFNLIPITQINVPTGYRLFSSQAAEGSTATIRNHVSFVGYTSNNATVVLYTDQNISDGTLKIGNYFYDNSHIDFL